jgi:beta-phosphoglucomutase-like phosphatase (HAD superfamily)
MKKLVLFDLDGVIVDTKQVHYEALNDAISNYDPNTLLQNKNTFHVMMA